MIMSRIKDTDCELYELDVENSKYITLPMCVMLDVRLTPLQKNLFGLINSLSKASGYCSMSNNSFSRLLGVARENISKAISGLEQYGFIVCELHRSGHGSNITERAIKCGQHLTCKLIKGSVEKITTVVTKTSPRSDQNVTGGSDQNITQYNNNLYNNVVGQSPTDYSAEVKSIVDYLNSKLGTKYRAQTANTRKHIIARLKEGYSVDDFKRVIDSKYSDWSGDTKMSRYLRPDTLFGSKFESYLNSATSNDGSSDLDALMRGYNR